jgi:competence protein ComEC
VPHRSFLGPFLHLLACACGLVPGGNVGGASPPPAGSLSVSIIYIGQGDGVLVQADGENYLIGAGKVEEG